MSELIPVLAIGLVLYAMKALPFSFAPVPRTALTERIFDLLPAALLMAMLVPPVLRPLLAAPPDPGAVLAVLAVAASFGIARLVDRPALAIACGLALLALAEWI